jgi:hypothetical protein
LWKSEQCQWRTAVEVRQGNYKQEDTSEESQNQWNCAAERENPQQKPLDRFRMTGGTFSHSRFGEVGYRTFSIRDFLSKKKWESDGPFWDKVD